MSRHRLPLKILIGTHNPGKIREIEAALSLLPITLIKLDSFPNISPVAEVGQTYQENAALKAMGYSRQARVCALADDSGLEVDALDGQPGVLSARFAGPSASDSDRNAKLLATLSSHKEGNRTARFVCSMALAGWPPGQSTLDTSDPQSLKVTEGKCEGTIATGPRGVHGFGFDPLFLPKGYDATFGELPDEVKSRISHRALALVQMREFLERWLLET